MHTQYLQQVRPEGSPEQEVGTLPRDPALQLGILKDKQWAQNKWPVAALAWVHPRDKPSLRQKGRQNLLWNKIAVLGTRQVHNNNHFPSSPLWPRTPGSHRKSSSQLHLPSQGLIRWLLCLFEHQNSMTAWLCLDNLPTTHYLNNWVFQLPALFLFVMLQIASVTVQ